MATKKENPRGRKSTSSMTTREIEEYRAAMAALGWPMSESIHPPGADKARQGKRKKRCA